MRARDAAVVLGLIAVAILCVMIGKVLGIGVGWVGWVVVGIPVLFVLSVIVLAVKTKVDDKKSRSSTIAAVAAVSGGRILPFTGELRQHLSISSAEGSQIVSVPSPRPEFGIYVDDSRDWIVTFPDSCAPGRSMLLRSEDKPVNAELLREDLGDRYADDGLAEMITAHRVTSLKVSRTALRLFLNRADHSPARAEVVCSIAVLVHRLGGGAGA